jgi:ferric-dicitrate binding protein FerR (iron transport regulator)
MNATPGNYPPAEMRASDADRDAVLSELSEHFQAGRLTNTEFDDRAGHALAARTWGELRNLLRDLPTTRPGPQSLAAASSASAPERPSGRPALFAVAMLAGLAIAVAMSVGVAHGRGGFVWILLAVLFVTRRMVRCAGASRRSGPPA